MSTTDNLIEVRGLHFAYGRNAILKGIDLDIPQGSIVAILGTSGSGKSTLLSLIGGSRAPAKGYVEVFGQRVYDLSHDELYAMRRRMGVMFQQGGLFGESGK